MPRSFSMGHTLALALGTHLALFFVAERLHAKSARDRQDAAPFTPIEVTTVVVPETPQVVPSTPPDPAVPPPVAWVDPRQSTSAASRATTNVGPVLTAPEAPPAAADPSWTVHVTNAGAPPDPARSGLAGLGIDGQNHFMGARTTEADDAREAAREANRAAGEAIRNALRAHDVELGLSSGGPVVAALEAVVRESTAPDESHAVLVAIADASGNVVRVDVEGATDEGAYTVVADALLQRLRGKPLRVPEGSNGLAVQVEVASALAAPSGGSIGIDPKKLGGHFDIADLGSRPKRVVHARIVAEKLL